MSYNNFKRKYPLAANNEKEVEKVDLVEPKFEESAECKIFEVKSSCKDFSTTAFLTNFRTVTTTDEDNQEMTSLLLIFYTQAGEWTSCYLKHNPYFLIRCSANCEQDVASFLEKKYEGKFAGLEVIEKMDLHTMNHLSGTMTRFLKCSFLKESEMLAVRSDIQKKLSFRKFRQHNSRFETEKLSEDVFEKVDEINEHDIIYSTRVCIDLRIRVSFWYKIKVEKGFLKRIEVQPRILEKPEFSILAFDIETTKLPLKFPDKRIDSVLLISYVIDKSTFLIVNREIVAEDIVEFEYAPKPEFAQMVTVYNEVSEKAAILKFFAHIRMAKPFIITSFNGDMFDIPFILKRAELCGIDVEREVGIVAGRSLNTFCGQFIFTHLDCYYWVKRDAFLPQGSQGLKSVTKVKLGYNPIDCDPEQILPMAKNNPQKLAEYSVSDAVATYFLYTKHIHDFIFALCTIVPMTPDDVLRRGSGTLCENLLMAQAYENQIVFPNKKNNFKTKYYNGYLIESETYVGGYVECLNNGAYRADIKQDFKLDAQKLKELAGSSEEIIEFYLKKELAEQVELSDVSNLEEVKESIRSQLMSLYEEVNASPNKQIQKNLLIYHVDVASMYPNIILTNRLQPTAIVNDQICSNCLYNEKKNKCKRPLQWDWRVTHYPIKKLEYEKLVSQADKTDIKSTLKVFCQKNFKSVHKTVIQPRENIVCMRENSFYVDTIRDFRDRRYDYKNKARFFSIEEKEQLKRNNFEKATEASTLSILYDSLQLAHKIILNSFYGYVMKKGARWYSMKMAAMVTNTGKNIIQEARNVFELIGKPLELDTDGIWTLLPKGFPEKYQLKTNAGKSFGFSFICSMINLHIHDKFKNPQYQDLDKRTQQYQTRDEMQIYFELDGPYKAMVIPASKEENKKLKKRYVVFNFDNKITEIKGFEIKRRGELGIVKIFQSEIFARFLEGNSLKTLYAACAETAKKWILILQNKASKLSDGEVFELIAEMKVLSKSIDEYGVQKGIALTAAKRLAQFLGDDLLKGTGLNCHFVISKSPESAPLNERAVPVSVFYIEEGQRRKYLKQWLKVGDDSDLSLKSILDWDYYIERLSSTIQKIIIIPAILQGLENPVPELRCPDWLKKRVNEKSGKQNTLNFAALPKKNTERSDNVRPIAVTVESDMVVDFNDLTLKKKEVDWPSDKLEQRKRMWIEHRNRSKMSVLGLDNVNDKQDICDFVNANRVNQSKLNWQVIKVSKSHGDGTLKYWYLVNGLIQSTQKVEVSRYFYINSFVEEKVENAKLKLSKKQLPHEKPNTYLYEFELNEFDFQAEYWKFTNFITDPLKEGVYETNIPLDFKAIMMSGSNCKNEYRGVPKTAISIDNLLMVEGAESFFSKSIFEPNRLTVYVWSMSYKQKLFTLIFSKNFVKILRLSRESKSEAIQQGILAKLKNSLKALAELPDFKHAIFNTEVTRDDIVTCKDKTTYAHKLGLIKNEIESLSKRCPILIVLSSKSVCASKEIASTWSDLPLLELGPLEFEMDREKLDELTCDNTFVDRSFRDLSLLENELMKIDRLAQFSRVPICNMKTTYDKSLIHCIDVLFGRELLKNNSILWYSNDKRPDLGVKGYSQYETEDFLVQQDLQCLFSQHHFGHTYVVEINMHKFFNNALSVMDQFVHLDREVRDKKQKQLGLWNSSTIYSMNNKSGLRVLKTMFKSWMDDFQRNNDLAASDLLDKLVPWICSEDSKFYDPILETTVLRVARSLFKELLVKLEDLGCRVVFANAYKIFIDTQKTSLASAINSTNFILETLTKEQLFYHAFFSIEQFYKTMLFYDINNYYGIVHRFDENSDVRLEEQEEQFSVVSTWNLHQFLPKECQQYFAEVLSRYIDNYFHIISTTISSIVDAKSIDSRIEEGVERYLMNDFCEDFYNLLSFLQDKQRSFEYTKYEQTQRKVSYNEGSVYKSQKSERKDDNELYADDESDEEDELGDDSFIENDDVIEIEVNSPRRRKNGQHCPPTSNWEMTNLIGGVRRSENVALEFMLLVLEVLSVNKDRIQELVEGLKTSFTRFLKVDETAKAMHFTSVYRNFTLMNISCEREGCNILKAVKIFEDFSSERKGWLCYCGNQYSSLLLENKIIEYVNECYKLLVTAPQKCVKCKRLRTDYFSNQCECHGSFKKDVHPVVAEFQKELEVKFVNLRALSVEAEFEMLEDLLSAFN